jgi:hypothetical protein
MCIEHPTCGRENIPLSVIFCFYILAIILESERERERERDAREVKEKESDLQQILTIDSYLSLSEHGGEYYRIFARQDRRKSEPHRVCEPCGKTLLCIYPTTIYSIDTADDNVDIITDNIDIATNNIDIITDNIDIATDNIDIATDNIDIATDNIDIATNNIDIIGDNIEVATNNIDIIGDNIEVATNNIDIIGDNIDTAKEVASPLIARSSQCAVRNDDRAGACVEGLFTGFTGLSIMRRLVETRRATSPQCSLQRYKRLATTPR